LRQQLKNSRSHVHARVPPHFLAQPRCLLPSLLTALVVLALMMPASITLAAPGDLDPTFSTDGKLITAFGAYSQTARTVAVQSDGKLVVAGNAFNGSTHDIALARYSGDGSLDTTFDADGTLTTAIGATADRATALAIQSDGKLVVVGYSWNGSNYDFALARYHGGAGNTAPTISNIAD
jgi:uncharacterized delta-60 repeat protein